jgi:hypothetical protein
MPLLPEDELLDVLSYSLIRQFRFEESRIKKSAPAWVGWNPNLFATKKGETWIILIRTAKYIPPVYWNLFFRTKKTNSGVKIFLATTSKNTSSFLKECRKNEIGIIEIKNKRIQIIYEPIFKRSRAQPKPKKCRLFKCFLSSAENTTERDIALRTIKNVWPSLIRPHGIEAFRIEEFGRHNQKRLWEDIKHGIVDSNYFLAVLSQVNYRHWVDREVRYAFSIKPNRKIAIVVDSVKEFQLRTAVERASFYKSKQLLTFIRGRNFGYARYDNLDDLERIITNQMARLLKSFITR